MEFINQNTELVITLLTMTLTWILGFISKRCPYVNNNTKHSNWTISINILFYNNQRLQFSHNLKWTIR